MLHITADLYSGRPNPSWLATDEQEVRAALREVATHRSLADGDASGGLGELRGFHVELRSDELALDHDLPSSLYLPIGSGTARTGGAAHALAERLLSLATPAAVEAAAAAYGRRSGAESMDHDLLRRRLDQKLGRSSSLTVADSRAEAEAEAQAPAGEGGSDAPEAQAAVTCMVEYAACNPGFWNNDAGIRTRNNCYNYASNKRTDTFAQPGRGSGQIYTAITCAAVSAAALRDGLRRRYVCFPDSEKPRYLVALVVAPGPGFVDFHWYRRNSEGFWSHKPGGTAVRNVDNANRVITNPETCNRGPYTHFCGYFYTCRSQRIR